MTNVEVTYRGPSGAYQAEYEGEWFELVRTKPTEIPEPLAERLLDVPGHTFAIGDESEAPAPEPTGAASGSGSGSGDDPEGVNATSPYFGGS